MGKILNLNIGDKFGDWTVIGLPFHKEKKRYTKCQCKCGSILDIPCDKIRVRKRCKKCFLSENKYGSNNPNWKGYKTLSCYYYHKLISSAKERNLEFNLSTEYLHNLFEQQKGICTLSGIKLNLHPNQTASLDRIDSNKGYIEENVQWVHKDINKIKQDYSEAYFIELCQKIVEYSKCG